MDKRNRSGQIVFGFDHSRFDAGFTKGIFKKPVKVGRDDHPDISVSYEARDRVMRLGGPSRFSLEILPRGLDITMENSPALGRRDGKRIEQL